MSQSDENARLCALHEYAILDTPTEPAFDHLAKLVANVAGTPIAVITLVDERRQWFKATVGLDVRETPRTVAICAHTILSDSPFIVEDTLRDQRFRDNPLVQGSPDIRFYAGIPLRNPQGHRLGAVAAIDTKPRSVSSEALDMMQGIAGQAMALLELRLQQRHKKALAARLHSTQRIAGIGSWELHSGQERLSWSPELYRIHGCDPESFTVTPESAAARIHPDDLAGLTKARAEAARTQTPLDSEHRIVRDNGSIRDVRERCEVYLDSTTNQHILVGTVQDLTDERGAQRRIAEQNQALQRAHAELSFHIDNSPLAVVEWDRHFRVVRWSPRAEAMFGWSESEVLGKKPEEWRFVHPDDVTSVAAVMRRLLQGEEPRNVSLNRNYTRDGELMQCEWYNSVLLNEDDRLAKVFSLVQDKTSQEMIERDRRQLATRLDAVMENMSEAFYLLDTDGRFLYLNPQAERILQRERTDLLGKGIWDAFPEARSTDIYPAFQRVLASRHAESLEIFHEPLQEWLDITATPSAEGLAVYIRIVSQRKHAELALSESEERFRLLSKATNDAIWDWDISTNTLWWNEGYETLFGFDRNKIKPSFEVWASRLHPEDRQRVLDNVNQIVGSTQEQWSTRYRFQREDGNYAVVMDCGHVIRDASGKAVRMVGGMTDLTERIALEEQLHQSQRMESIGQLTGGIAHDFNNLLTVIQGNAELLREQLDDQPRLAELARMMEAASQRGAELTHRLLAFARRQALEPRVIELNHLLAGMDSLLRRTLDEHIEIELKRADGLWPVSIDPGQLESALLNLCINARDAMPQGGRLTVETSNVTLDEAYAAQNWEVLPGQYVMLAVSDSGSGIAAEHLQHVFEPFYTTKEQGKGTGLGLAMVFGFVKQSHGHVTIYSEPGEGTTVKLYIPRYEGDTARHGDPQTVPAIDLKATPATILLVEDDALVRRYAEDQLVAMGYSVLVAENGPQAMEILREREDIDLLFTDVVMPGGMGGRQLVDAARALRPGLRVLYTSGYTENAIVHAGRLDPGVLLLGKPYRRAELARKIAEAILHG